MLPFLLVVHALIAAALVAVILMQRSEGGGLTSSGNANGMLSARGAADFLTRLTTVLATLFVVMAIALAAYGSVSRAPREIDTSLAGAAGGVGDIPLGDQPAQQTPAPATQAPADDVSNGAVPLAQ